MEKWRKVVQNVLKKCEQFWCVLVDKNISRLCLMNKSHVGKFLYTQLYTLSGADYSLLTGGFAQFPHSLNTTTNLYIINKEENS